jgi:hypothetical protein
MDPLSKAVEIIINEDTGVWLGLVFIKSQYDKLAQGVIISPFDVFAGMDETTVLSRIKEHYSSIEIRKTDGEIKRF